VFGRDEASEVEDEVKKLVEKMVDREDEEVVGGARCMMNQSRGRPAPRGTWNGVLVLWEVVRRA
jgi:hypothetical protein